MINDRLDQLDESPVRAAGELLADVAPPPDRDPVVRSVGDPSHGVPAFVRDVRADGFETYGRYPPTEGTAEPRRVGAEWLARRHLGVALVHDLASTADGLERVAASR